MPRDLMLVLSLRLWQGGAGLVSTILAVHFLSAQMQGWYYSFLSVASIYTLFDLGLSTVLIQVSAHAFAGLRWREDKSVDGGNADYFHALVGRAARWYALSAVVFLALLVPGGMVFFGAKADNATHWLMQWIVLCAVTAGGLVVMPFLSVLEGTGRIVHVYALRLTMAVCGSLACWLMFATGAGLWATAMVPAMAFVIAAGWLLKHWPQLCATAWRNVRSSFDWRREVWPLQWRVGISLLCGFLMTQINTPLLFHTQGAVIAGRFGLSLAIANMLGLIAQSWITRRVPLMARAVALRDWPLLDRLFMRDFAASSAIFIAGALAACLLVAALDGTAYASRILPLWQLAGLFAYTFSNQLIGGLAAHLRSFRREPLASLITVTTIVTVPLNFWAAKHYSSAGLVTVLATANSLVTLPIATFIWHRCNRAWRHEA